MRLRVMTISSLILLGACANQGDAPAANGPGASGPAAAAPTASAAPQGDIVGTPAPGSKFSRVQIGMAKRQVEDLIGEPNDQGNHITGKAFIPFYFGSGTSETDAHYKGEGILTYASRGVGDTAYFLTKIKVDSTESGYNH